MQCASTDAIKPNLGVQFLFTDKPFRIRECLILLVVPHVHLQIRRTFWSSSTSFFQQVFYVILFLIILSFMLSTYISSSLTQLTIYNLFLRAILYKEFGLKSTLLLVAILKLFVSLNAMAGNSVGVEDCEILVND